MFDSGLGGLLIFDLLKRELPNEWFVYLGDTMHMPYGQKTPEQIHHYVTTAMRWLIEEQGVKLVVVACNTASSVAANVFAKYADVPFVDPVAPICRWLTDHTSQYPRIGLMATPATVASNRYGQLMPPGIELHSVSCGGLATLIEEGRGDSEECRQLLHTFVDPLVAWGMQGLILGCTHYPYVTHQIMPMLPAGIEILDPGVQVVQTVRQILIERRLAAPPNQPGGTQFFVTQAPERFFHTGQAMPFRYLEMEYPTLLDLFSDEALLKERC